MKRTLISIWNCNAAFAGVWGLTLAAFAVFLRVNMQTGPLIYAPMWDGPSWDNPAGLVFLAFKIAFVILAVATLARMFITAVKAAAHRQSA